MRISRLPLRKHMRMPSKSRRMTSFKLVVCTSPYFLINYSVTCGLYINIVLNDYVGTLVGIPELNTAWFLDPYVGAGTEPLFDQATPIATGNQVSCEFNL